MAIDYDAPEGQVRLLIADTGTSPILDDGQINGFLSLNDGNVRLAAADALDAIASSEALISKAIKTQDLQTNGPATATALRDHANQLRQQALDLDGADMFDIVDTRPDWSRDCTYPVVWGL